MDSLIPGMDKRYKVSWMDRQSSSEIKIAFDLLPVIWIGSWDSAAWSSNLKRLALASVALIVVIRITSIVNVHENVRKVKVFELSALRFMLCAMGYVNSTAPTSYG